MAKDKSLNNKFSWGETVMIKTDAPNQFRPSTKGSICGIRYVDSYELSITFNSDLKSLLYLIEFENGEAIEIPEEYLLKFEI